MSAALKRVEAAMARQPKSLDTQWLADLRSVVRLAKQAGELKNRITIARRDFYAAKLVARLSVSDGEKLERFARALDLRRPLKAGRK